MKKLYCYTFGVFFISLSVLIYELALIRLSSIVLFSNLAFLGITIALFGIALGGVLVYRFPKYFSKNYFSDKISLWALIYSLAIIIFTISFLHIDFSNRLLILIPIFFLFASIPFICANICLSLLFKYKSEAIEKLYFFDLIGAGSGAFLAVVLQNYFRIIDVILLSGFIGLVAVSFFSIGKKKYLIGSFLCGFVLLGFVFINNQANIIKISYTKKGKETNVKFEKYNSFSRITIREEKTPRIVSSLPIDSDVSTIKQKGIEIDADAYTPVMSFDGNLESVDFLRRDLSSIAYFLNDPGGVLIIGPGGGRDVLMALLFGQKVLGVDINPIIVNDIMRNELKDFSGELYFRPDVRVIVSEGRSFIHSDKNKYNVISLPLVDTWASTAAGNLVLVESNLYTVEAFEDYLSHLKKHGILTISRWEIDGMRLVSLFIEASKRLEIMNPENKIFVVRNSHKNEILNNYLFKIEDFTHEEIATIESFAQDNKFEVIYSPTRNYENNYNTYLNAKNKSNFINNYDINLKPVYDDNPFFFFITPLSKLYQSNFHLDGGLFYTFIVVLFFTLLCIIYPIRRTPEIYIKDQILSINGYLGYFSSLGVAFMFIEIALIQKFILYLEQPIYSYSVVIVTILTFAGIGSFFTNKYDVKNKKTFFNLGLSIFAIIIAYIIFLSHLIKLTIDFTILQKVVLTILLNIPLSMLMGMMLPLGIKKLNESNLNFLTPFCWALNGAMSVLSSVTAIFFAISFGFNFVLFLGGVTYIIALIFINKTVYT